MDDGVMTLATDLIGWLAPAIGAVVAWLARRVAVLEARVQELDAARDVAVVEHAKCRAELASLREALRKPAAALALVLALVVSGCAGASPPPLERVRQVACGVAVPACGVVARVCDGDSGGESP